MSARTVSLSRYGEDIEALISAAVDAVEALDKYADADQPSGSHPIPNAAMSAQMELEAVLTRLKVLPIPRHQASREKLIEYVKTVGHSRRTERLREFYMKPEHLTDDQLRVLANDIASNLRFEQRLNRRNRARMEAGNV